MKTLTGEEFKKIHASTEFYKLTVEDEIHNGYQFKTGLNIDPIEFNPFGSCKKGGFYFTDLKNIPKYLRYNNKKIYWIRKVNILDDSKIHYEIFKYKTDKFKLSERTHIYDDEKIRNVILSYDMNLFCNLKDEHKTYELCMKALKHNELMYIYIKEEYKTDKLWNKIIENLTNKIFMTKDDVIYYKSIDKEERENILCELIMYFDGLSIKYLCDYSYDDKHITQKICDVAFDNENESIKYIPLKFHTDKMRNEIIKLENNLIFYIHQKYVDKNIYLNVVKKDGLSLGFIEHKTYELCKTAVQENGYALKYIKKQTEELCKLAVQQNGSALQFVKEQTEEICELAVQQNGSALRFVEKQTEEICRLAVQQNGMALRCVKEQTEEICKLAVQQNGFALQFVKEQTEEICKFAVKENKSAFRYVSKEFKINVMYWYKCYIIY